MGKGSRRYAELAGYANDRGYPKLKPDTVQYWTRRGLVPHARPQHVDFAVRVWTEPIWTGHALLRGCHYRYDQAIRDISQVGVLVWLERIPVDEKLVRDGLRVYASAGPRLLELVSRGSALDDAPMSEVIGAAADKLVYDRRLGDLLPGAAGIPRPDLATGVADLLGLLILRKHTETRELAQLAKAYGLNGEEFTSTILGMGHRLLSPAALNDRVATATTAELGRARDLALGALEEAPSVPPPVRIVTLLAFLAIGGDHHSG